MIGTKKVVALKRIGARLCVVGTEQRSEAMEVTIEMVRSAIESLDTDWAATYLDELFEAGAVDALTYRRLEAEIDAANA